jgi:hypothetical protein
VSIGVGFSESFLAHYQLLFASCFLFSMITHRTHLNPMVNVELYHLFAYFVKEKTPLLCQAGALQQALKPGLLSYKIKLFCIS